MIADDNSSAPSKPLRARAETVLAQNPGDLGGMAREDLQKLVQELQLQQSELELENAGLRRAQQESEAARQNLLSDLTEQKRTEAASRAQELQLRLITDTTPAMLTRCSRNLEYQFVNRAYAEMLGLPPEQMVGKSIVEIMGVEGFEVIRPYVESVLQGQRVEYEQLVPLARVGRKFLHVVYTPERDEQGGVRGWVATISDISERKRAEAALRESEARFGEMADAAPVLIWMSGPDKLWTYFNQPWLRFTGGTLEQALGNGWLEGVHPDDLEGLLKTYVDAFDARQEFRMEYRLRRHDGEYRWVLGHGIPRFTSAQEFLGYIGSCVDLTARKQAEVALRQAQDELEERVRERTKQLKWANEALRGEKAFSESLVELAPAVIAVIDVRGNLIRTNAFMQQLTGYTFAETQGRNVIEIFCPQEEQPRMAQVLQEALHGRLTQPVIAPLRTRDGLIRQIEWHSKPVVNASGEQSAVLAIGHDITERKRAEEFLLRSERHLSNFFNQAPIGLVWLSASGTVIRANQAQLELLGCRPEDFLSRPFGEFLTDPGDGKELLKRLATRGTVRNLPLLLRRQDGSTRPVLVDANSAWNGSQFEYSSIFLRDITDRLQLEQEILHISEREQVRIAQDLHDGLGQILVGASYLAGTVRQDLAAKGSPEARQVGRVWEVINEALAMTRNLARGLHPVEAEPNGLMVALEALAVRTTKLFAVRCQFNSRRPVLFKDHTMATHLFRIAQEAVTNAIKHAQPRSIQIHLTQPSWGIILRVRDDGLGMPARPLEQAGIGLRIMHYRAGIIGGSLVARNEARGGTSLICAIKLASERSRKHAPSNTREPNLQKE